MSLLIFKGHKFGAIDLDILFHRASPSHRILYDLLNVFISECRIGFVTGLEIEDLSMTASPGATASEYLAALEPTKENYLLGRGNVEHFAVHLLRVENEGLVNSCGDWVIGLDGPYALSFLCSPFKRAGGSHQLLEYLGIVS